ncbi:MAG TPA: 4'-phosphopantetheinyl transferase superfamily protein [Longimicrobiaceae bacterium]
MDRAATDAPNDAPPAAGEPAPLDAVRAAVEAHPLRRRGAAHLHLFEFSSLAPLDPLLGRLLEGSERDRAGRFHYLEDRQRYQRGRGLLRWLLGAYLARAPGGLVFDYAQHGRPSLRGGGIEFNVSHTRRYLALAFAADGALGVDVEGDRGATDLLRIARRFFAEAEYEKLASLPEGGRTRAFLRCWTQKEAYIKAHGVGLSMPLNRFEVGVLPEDPCGLRAAFDDSSELARWQFAETDQLQDAHVALAVEGVGREVRVWRWGHEPVSPSNAETAPLRDGPRRLITDIS